jgi:hypothetical protein
MLASHRGSCLDFVSGDNLKGWGVSMKSVCGSLAFGAPQTRAAGAGSLKRIIAGRLSSDLGPNAGRTLFVEVADLEDQRRQMIDATDAKLRVIVNPEMALSASQLRPLVI